MRIRDRALPAPWYPEEKREIESFMKGFEARGGDAGACLSPHAGWTYSGSIAASAIASLDRRAQTIVVAGGHLGPGAALLLASEDAFRTPMGLLEADSELRSLLEDRFGFHDDRDDDNTVEILLPMIAVMFPSAKILWLRLPAAMEAFLIGEEISRIALSLRRHVAVVASTDLTHYGPNYGFAPLGLGKDAERWVREQNDRKFLEAVCSGDGEAALRRALESRAACSPGAALCAMGYAKAHGLGTARVLDYATSADIRPASSFVGYAAISWSSSPD